MVIESLPEVTVHRPFTHSIAKKQNKTPFRTTNKQLYLTKWQVTINYLTIFKWLSISYMYLFNCCEIRNVYVRNSKSQVSCRKKGQNDHRALWVKNSPVSWLIEPLDDMSLVHQRELVCPSLTWLKLPLNNQPPPLSTKSALNTQPAL